MVKTAHILYNNVLNGLSIDHPAIIDDFFGENVSDEKYRIIYGLYEGLIKSKDVSKELLYDCFITNRLDELIHKKYTFHSSIYYKQFLEKNIAIGRTFYDLSSDDDEDNDNDNDKLQKQEILTDDFCPNCSSEGFYMKTNLISDNAPDCFYCHKTVGETEQIYHCNKCTSI